MLLILQFLVYFLFIPVIYLAILVFDFFLITRATTLIQRWQSLAGILAGLLLSLMVIIIDQFYGPLIPRQPESYNINSIWQLIIITFIIGFIVMLLTEPLIRHGVGTFVILFNIMGLVTLTYFLATLTEIRPVVAIGTIGILLGVITYFMLFPVRIVDSIRNLHEIDVEEE